MAKILQDDGYKTVIELSSNYEAGYHWLTIAQCVAQIDIQGVALCSVDASDDEHPVTRLELNHAEMTALMDAYQAYMQSLEASRSSDEDLGDIDDHPF